MAESCSVCDAEFATPAELIGHMKVHAKDPPEAIPNPIQERGRKFLCAACGAGFDTPEALAAHNESPHPIGKLVTAMR